LHWQSSPIFWCLRIGVKGVVLAGRWKWGDGSVGLCDRKVDSLDFVRLAAFCGWRVCGDRCVGAIAGSRRVLYCLRVCMPHTLMRVAALCRLHRPSTARGACNAGGHITALVDTVWPQQRRKASSVSEAPSLSPPSLASMPVSHAGAGGLRFVPIMPLRLSWCGRVLLVATRHRRIERSESY
jgi:hypothetical protein